MRKYLKSGVFLFCTASLGGAHADCLVDGSNAVSVQANSGQGSFTCADLSDADGPLEDLVAMGIATRGAGTANRTASWEIKPELLDTNNDGIQDFSYKVSLVQSLNGGQGSSCNYLYDGQATEGDNLGDPDGPVRINDLLVCGNPVPVAVEPEEPETSIITTAFDSCEATFDYEDQNGTEVTDLRPPIAFFYDYGGPSTPESIAACAGATNQTIGQVECIPPELYVPQTPTGDCVLDNSDGTLPLTCAPINIDATFGGLETCWFYQNKVDRESGNYIPSSGQIGALDIKVEVTEGSTCYTYFLRGRAYISCF